MTRHALTAVALLLCQAAWASVGGRTAEAGNGAEVLLKESGPAAAAAAWQTVDVLPGLRPDGKLLSMEDVISAGVHPRLKSYYWEEDGSLAEGPGKGPKAPAGLRAFSRDGSLYLVRDTDTLCIAAAQEGDGIVYGTSVSRNEFGINGGIFPSPDGRRIAFYRKDQRAVTQFPLLDISTRTGSLRNIRYPMNGMASEIISLGVYDTIDGTTVWLQCDEFSEERYLTNVSWSADSQGIFVQVVDRSQHHMRLCLYNASDGTLQRRLLSEDNEAWVEPREPLRHFRDDFYIYSTANRDGYDSLYLLDAAGGGIWRLTEVDADVDFVATDGRFIYYMSAEVSPAESHLYRIELRPGRKAHAYAGKAFAGPGGRFGGKTRVPLPGQAGAFIVSAPQALTPGRGVHRVSFSPDCSRFLDRWSSLGEPGRLVLRSADGTLLEDLDTAADPLEGFARCTVELGTVRSSDGRFDNHYRLIKPLGFEEGRQYPVIVYVYGGPHSQMVTDSWLGGIRMWEMAMAQRGYVVYVQDNRGTDNHGLAYAQAINRKCGVHEMEDQVAGLEALLSRGFCDRSRIGVCGWSYGGFMTISLMTHYPSLFRAGACGGPVIDWKWYEIMYGERYMDTPETNPEGFRETSLLSWADKLEGPLLICQGAVDDTVVWQHSLSFVQKCVEAGKLLEYFPYPLSEHNVRGPWRAQMYALWTGFFERNL